MRFLGRGLCPSFLHFQSRAQSLSLIKYSSEPRYKMRTYTWTGHPCFSQKHRGRFSFSTGSEKQALQVAFWSWLHYIFTGTWVFLPRHSCNLYRRSHRWARSWMPSPLRTKMFVKCSEAVRGQGTFSSLACNFSESVSRPNSSHSSFHVCISTWLESVCLQKVSSGWLNGALHVYTCASLGGEIPSEFFYGSECCKHLN